MIHYRIIAFMADALNSPYDHFKAIFGLFLMVPIGYLLTIPKNPKIRTFNSLLGGVLCIFYHFDFQIIFLVLQYVSVYFLLRYILPRKYAGWSIMIYVLTWTTVVGIWRYITDYGGWHIDISMAMTISTIYLSVFAFDYQDGKLKTFSEIPQFKKWQEEKHVKELPNLYEFISFCFMFGQCFVGPIYTYREYQEFIYLRGNYTNIPNRLYATLLRLFQTAVCCGLYLTLAIPFEDPTYLYKENSTFRDLNPFYKCCMLHMICLGMRTRFYIAWLLAEAMTISTGFAYNSSEKTQNGSPKFDKTWSIGVLGYETSINSNILTYHWNHQGHIWLKYYCYYRILKPNKQNLTFATYMTYFISALWHGVYLVYYICFVLFGVVNHTFQHLYKLAIKYPIFRTAPFMILYFLLSSSSLHLLGGSVKLLLLDYFWELMKIMWFIPAIHIVLLLIFTFTSVTKLTPEEKKQKLHSYPFDLRIYEIPSLGLGRKSKKKEISVENKETTQIIKDRCLYDSRIYEMGKINRFAVYKCLYINLLTFHQICEYIYQENINKYLGYEILTKINSRVYHYFFIFKPYKMFILYEYIHTLSQLVDYPYDQLKLVLGMVLIIPIGWIINCIYSRKVRLFLSLFIGMAMIYYHFDNQIIFLIGQFVVVYMMAKILPRRILGRCVTMFTLACLLGSSIWRMITDFGGWHMDITIIFTVTTYTLSVFAFDYQDGGMPPSQVPDLKKWQESHKLSDLPSFYEYMSFTFFFGCCLLGPIYNFSVFRDFINRKGGFSNIPNTILPSLFKLSLVLLAAASLLFLFAPHYPVDYFISKHFHESAFYCKLLSIYIGGLAIRMKFFVAWFLADSGAIALGYSYNGKDKKGKSQFTGTYSVNFEGTESTINSNATTEHWNHSASIWLKYYIYCRFINPKATNKTFAKYVTFTISGIWHGLYFSYIIVFLSFAILNQTLLHMYRIALKYKILRTRLFIIIYWLITKAGLDWLGISMTLLEIHRCYIFWQDTYILIFSIIFFCLLFSLTSLSSGGRKNAQNQNYYFDYRVYEILPIFNRSWGKEDKTKDTQEKELKQH